MCDDVEPAEYGTIVKDMSKDASRTSRERELERVFGESMPVVLRRVLDDTGGRKRPAIAKINDRLRNSEHYDHEAKGLVSPPTFYSWLDTYGEALSDVV